MQHIVNELLRHNDKDRLQFPISKDQYEAWSRQAFFDQICSQRLGQSFCNHFNVHDNILFYLLDSQEAQDYIQKNYVDSSI